jgi:two-component sensor histidine kinase/Tfp pilus assembly protein PilF
MNSTIKWVIILSCCFLSFATSFAQNKNIDLYLNKAWEYAVSSNDSAVFYISKLKTISQEEKNKTLEVKTLEIEGLYFEIAKANYSKASELYLNAIKIAEQNKLDYVKDLYHTLGIMFHTTDEYEKAEIYYQKSLAAAKKLNDNDLFVRCLINLGSVNSSNKKYIQAEKLFLESLEYDSPFETKRSTYSNLGNMKIRENKFKEAIYFLEKAVQINPETGLEGDIMDYSYLITAKSKLKNFEGIDTLLKKSEKLLSNNHNLRNRSIMLKSIGNAYEATKDFENATIYKNKYIEVYDSLKFLQRDEIIYEVEAKYQTEKKEAELQKKIKEKNNLVFLILFFGLAILILIYLTILNFKQKEKVKKQKAQLEILIDEKNILLKETHHRVKNSFQIVSSLLYLQSESITNKEAAIAVKEAQNRVKSMILIHQKLYSKDKLAGIDSKEYIEDLVDDIIKNHNDNINTLTVTKNIDSRIFSIDTITYIGLIINELITNVIKYAFPKKHSNPNLMVSFIKKGNNLELIISDNGIGISNQSNPESFGLKLINSLSKKLKAEVNFENNNGTTVTLLITKFEELT